MRVQSLVLFFGVICIAAGYENGDVRLVEGPNSYTGLVQVYYNSRWGFVCDDILTNSGRSFSGFGRVVCGNLQESYVSIRDNVTDRGRTNSYFLDQVACRGTETNLDQCGHSPWFTEDCGPTEHVYVTCGDIDECLVYNGGCSHTCVNTLGSFHCVCPRYLFLAEDKSTCMDPCDNPECSQICAVARNKKGYICSCNAGYNLALDGFGCDDINECLVNNGGCSHTCVNTPRSFHCECPRYLFLADNNSTCMADGFIVDCSSSAGMTIFLDRKTFFFLPNELTLTNTSCTSASNETHIWLHSELGACSTTRKVIGNEVIYSNAVLDTQASVGEIRYFDSIEIPFQCKLSTNHTISQGLSPNRMIMRKNGNGYLYGSLDLMDGDDDSSKPLPSNDIRQGELVHARLSASMSGLSFSPSYCDVLSEDRSSSQRVVESGRAANFLTKIISSTQYRFSYPVFTFSSKNRRLNLDCHSSFWVNDAVFLHAVNARQIVTQQQIDQAISPTVPINEVVSTVVDSSKDVSLTCGPKSMTLSIATSTMADLSLDDLQPLKENCLGFRFRKIGGNYVYNIPLSDCGAQVEKTADTITFTNSLVYARSLKSQIKYFSEVILTHSCSYPLSRYQSNAHYTVRSNNYTFEAENIKPAKIGVSFNAFSGGTFRKLINSGGSVSIAEGRYMFGNISVASSDPNLKVSLDECKVTPTNSADDPNSHFVVRNGCTTAYGTRMFSLKKFAPLTSSFAGVGRGRVYLHCTVVVCSPNNMSRCRRKCPSSALPGDAVGKRDVNSESLPELVKVTAGPFYI